MGWSGKLHAWAWRKQANMIKYSKQKEEQEYLEELKKKLHGYYYDGKTLYELWIDEEGNITQRRTK